MARGTGFEPAPQDFGDPHATFTIPSYILNCYYIQRRESVKRHTTISASVGATTKYNSSVSIS
jgi:hypothetical protein